MEHVLGAHAPAASAARRPLLACGMISSVLYPAVDVLAASLYPGYSIADQAVSELFAIGAPTSRLVVPLFTLSSALLAAFAGGVWLSSGGRRAVRLLAWTMAGSALNALVLWNLFPMHMRGAEPTLTDTMHLVFAVNPFVLASLIVAAVAFGGRLRFVTLATIVLVVVLAAVGFSNASRVLTGGATPWLGLTERAGQYVYQLWQAALAVSLLSAPATVPSASPASATDSALDSRR